MGWSLRLSPTAVLLFKFMGYTWWNANVVLLTIIASSDGGVEGKVCLRASAKPGNGCGKIFHVVQRGSRTPANADPLHTLKSTTNAAMFCS